MLHNFAKIKSRCCGKWLAVCLHCSIQQCCNGLLMINFWGYKFLSLPSVSDGEVNSIQSLPPFQNIRYGVISNTLRRFPILKMNWAHWSLSDHQQRTHSFPSTSEYIENYFLEWREHSHRWILDVSEIVWMCGRGNRLGILLIIQFGLLSGGVWTVFIILNSSKRFNIFVQFTNFKLFSFYQRNYFNL